MRILTIIAARRDSKGIPGKNWKPLNGKPLIAYTLESALEISAPEDICVTTNSKEVMGIAREYGIEVPFERPEHLSTDHASSREAILHGLDYFEFTLGKSYDVILQLQPTAPFRKKEFIEGAIETFEKKRPEMVVSAYEPGLNPYYNIYTENEAGHIARAIPSPYTRRQDCPPVYALNGSIYVMDIAAIRLREIHEMSHVVKYVMPAHYSVDLDTEMDWDLAEFLISKNRF